MSLYGQLIKQEADYTALVDEKLPECEKLVQVMLFFGPFAYHTANQSHRLFNHGFKHT